MPYKGGRRKKRRTHVKPSGIEEKVPRSLVLRRGRVDVTVTELLADLRQMMMPHTAPRLRVTKGNTLRDFVDVAGPLGVTHLMMLSQSETNVTLRLARTPRGPTLNFRVEAYSLGRQVRAAQRKPVDIAGAYDVAPLVVMHNFTNLPPDATAKAPGQAGVPLADALKLAMATFQHMFPPINPAAVKLADCRRVVMVHFNKATRSLELRHYFVRAVPVGVSRAVKKVVAGAGGGSGVVGGSKLPDLSRLDDISQFVLGSGNAARGGGASDSEFEGGGDGDAGRVTLPADFRGAGNTAASQSSIRLSEIGPRLTLKLVKIEQGLCGGEVLYHAFVAKSERDAAELRARAAAREAARQERKATQEANVARKTAEAAAKKAAREARKAAKQEAAKAAAAAGTLGTGDDDEKDEDEEDGGDEEAEGGSDDDAAAAGGDEDDDDGGDADGESAGEDELTDDEEGEEEEDEAEEDDDDEGDEEDGGGDDDVSDADDDASVSDGGASDDDDDDEDEDDDAPAAPQPPQKQQRPQHGAKSAAAPPAPAAAAVKLAGAKRRR